MRKVNKTSYLLLRRLYEATRRLEESIKEGQHPVIQKMIRQALEKTWAKAKKAGLDEDSLSSSAESIWIMVSADDVSMHYRDTCVLHMRHVQRISDQDDGNPLLACPHSGDRECGPFCGFYQEATDGQVEDFESGRNLDDGKEYPK